MPALESFGVVDDSTTTLSPAKFVDPSTIRDSDLLDICDELFNNRYITFLDLSQIKISAEVAAALGVVLSRRQGSRCVVQYVKLENCGITVDALKALLSAIGNEGTNNRLEILDLSKNPIGDAGATFLSEALEVWNVSTIAAPVTTITSNNSNIYSDAALTSCIRTLELRNCRIGPQGATAIGKLLGTLAGCRLTSLNLDDNKLRYAGIVEICNGLSTNKQLRLLSIADNNINAEGGQVLAQTLRVNTTLETLQAGKNYLSESMPALALALCRRGTCARLLDFSTNRINATMCRSMAQVLEGNQFYVSCLTLEGNPIGDEGLVALLHAIKGTPVQFLDVSDTNLTSASAPVLADMILLCPLLNSLQIDGNAIGDEGLARVAAAAGDSKTLSALNLEKCGLGPHSVDVLASSIARRRKFRSLALAENPRVSLLPILDALSTCNSLEYLDLSDNGIEDSESVLRALVSVFSSNEGLKEVILEHNPLARGFPDGLMTRELARSLVADSSLFGVEADRGGNSTIDRSTGRMVAFSSSNAGGSAVNNSDRRKLLQGTFKPKWSTTTAMDHRSLIDEDTAAAHSDGEDGQDIPLIPHHQSLQHALYPGYGNGRFSSGQSVQQLSNPVPYTMEMSKGTKPVLLKSCDLSTELQVPLRRPLKQSPYSLAALENNKGQLPVTEDHLRKKFEELDVDGLGYLSREEFKRVYLSYQNFGLKPKEEALNAILDKYSMNADGRVSFDEFCIAMLKLAQM
eukprot:GDKK01063689.1.p1 GENE.GDKK01063689.1~~GDKK01063689.1.p1  ORF type:complete len:746 (-),score=73.52 GDKK01063689.1:100-2337(-)